MWIPSLLTNKSLRSHQLKKILRIMSKLEKTFSLVAKQRFSIIFKYKFIQSIHLLILACSSIGLALPIPFTNWVFAWINILLSVAILMSDGLIVLLVDTLFIGAVITISMSFI
jgi:hypothetical protein